MIGWVLIVCMACITAIWVRVLTRLERTELARIASEESTKLRTAYPRVPDATDRLTRTTEASRLQVERLQATIDRQGQEVAQLGEWRRANNGLVQRGR